MAKSSMVNQPMALDAVDFRLTFLTANKSGKPFTFKLGNGEVIRGWDIGVEGMLVGGERRIVVPASLAYGKKGMPGIPKNSELTFDMKLLEIH